MKKAFKALILTLFVVITLCSCATISKIIDLLGYGKPSWYLHPQESAGKGKVAFIGEGNASSERQAKLLAVESLKDNLETYLGTELEKEQYRRLSTLSSIEEFGLKIEASSLVNEKDGSITFYLLALGDKEKLEQGMSLDAKLSEEKVQKTIELIKTADELVKKNQDIEAVKYYLQSMALSYNLKNLDEEYSFDEIFDVVEDILSNAKIIITNPDREAVTCTVTVKLKSGLTSSSAKNCPIKASYVAISPNGDVYDDSFIYLTSEKGSFDFKPLDASILAEGKVKFSFDLDDALAEVESVAPFATTKLKSICASKSVSFTYFKSNKKGTVAICGIKYDEEGEFVEAKTLTDLLKTTFADNYANCNPYYFTEELEDAVLVDKIGREIPGVSNLILYKAGVYDKVNSGTGISVVTVEGQYYLYNLQDGSLKYSSDVFYTNGFGNSEKEATEQAFEAMTELIYSQVRSIY